MWGRGREGTGQLQSFFSHRTIWVSEEVGGEKGGRGGRWGLRHIPSKESSVQNRLQN